MNTENLIEFAHRGLILVLWVALPTVVTAAAVGIVVALIQATTQLQDQTAAQVLKLIVACLVLVLSAGWAGISVLNFVDEMMRTIGFHAPTPIL
jgi:type III secretion protein S